MLPQEQHEQQLVPEHNDVFGNVLEHGDALGDHAFGDAFEHKFHVQKLSAMLLNMMMLLVMILARLFLVERGGVIR